MESLHQLEIAWIWLIQSIGVWLAGPMQVITMIGNEEFFLLFMPLLYWSIDAALGLRVALMLLLSTGLNLGLKLAIHGSRPYWISPTIHAYSAESSFGFPSGHSQTAAGIWGFIAARSRGAARIALIALIFLIGFSRVFLGVHYISDVLGGWLIGGLLVWGMVSLEQPLGTWLGRQPLSRVLALALLSSILLGAVVLIPAAATQNWQMPQEWAQNALAAAPESKLDPLKIDSAFTNAGTWLGMLAGVAWLHHRQGGFSAEGTPAQRILRYLIGLAGILLLWYGLGKIFPREANLISYALRFLRYLLVGLWVSALAPLLFLKLGLATAPHLPFAPEQKSSIL